MRMDDDNKIEAVRLHEGSPLLPKGFTENLAFQVFFRPGLILNFFKTPTNPATFDVFSGDRPDIEMRRDRDDNDRKKIEWEYDLKDRSITFRASGIGILSRPETWNSSGRIVSMLDLPGAQLIVQLGYDQAVSALASADPKERLERINLPNSIRVYIQVGDRRELTLRGRDFEQYKGPNGTTNFVYTFPKTYEELLQLP